VGTGLVFEFLGQLEVRLRGALKHVGGPRQSTLLVCPVNRVVSYSQLIEELRDDQQIGSMQWMLWVQISRLRHRFADCRRCAAAGLADGRFSSVMLARAGGGHECGGH
jgi:hypothetical protein